LSSRFACGAEKAMGGGAAGRGRRRARAARLEHGLKLCRREEAVAIQVKDGKGKGERLPQSPRVQLRVAADKGGEADSLGAAGDDAADGAAEQVRVHAEASHDLGESTDAHGAGLVDGGKEGARALAPAIERDGGHA